MNPPKLVIFDCDGVLIDSEPLSTTILIEDLAIRGLTMTETDIEKLFMGNTVATSARVAAKMGARIPDDWSKVLNAKMFAGLRAGVAMIEGVEPLMDRLDAAGVKYCVGSNGPDAQMEISIGQHKALYARVVGRIFSGPTLNVAKPDPDLFLIAAREMGFEPADCVVIEDSKTGCIAARRAGMRCFGLAENHDGAHLAAEDATVVKSLHDIAPLLGV